MVALSVTGRLRERLGRFWPVMAPTVLVCIVTALASLVSAFVIQRAIVEGLIFVGVAVGLYTFSGNSGILSFGHLTFMAIGAYVVSWFRIPATLKSLYYNFPQPLTFLSTAHASPLVAVLIGAGVATVIGAIVSWPLCRLSGMEASIATLALLLVANVVISNWDNVTQGQRTVVGVPDVVGIGEALVFAIIAIVASYAYQRSRSGRRLRASREELDAARVLGVNVVRERWLAFTVSALIVGIAGGLYAQFAVGFNPNDFYLNPTFLIVAMVIIGGRGSLGGAVVGAVLVWSISTFLTQLEAGITIWGLAISVPAGFGDAVLGVLLLLVLILTPEGVVGSREIRWPFGTVGMADRAVDEYADTAVAATSGARASDQAGAGAPDGAVK